MSLTSSKMIYPNSNSKGENPNCMCGVTSIPENDYHMIMSWKNKSTRQTIHTSENRFFFLIMIPLAAWHSLLDVPGWFTWLNTTGLHVVSLYGTANTSRIHIWPLLWSLRGVWCIWLFCFLRKVDSKTDYHSVLLLDGLCRLYYVSLEGMCSFAEFV